MWLPKKYFSCDISSTGEIKHLSQIGKVLVFAPSRRHYLSSLDNNVISQTELLEFMLCTCDFSVWNITPAPSLPHLLSTCSSPGKTHPTLQASPPQGPPPLWCLFGFPRWHGPGFWDPPTLRDSHLLTHLQLSQPSYTHAFILYCIDFQHR